MTSPPAPLRAGEGLGVRSSLRIRVGNVLRLRFGDDRWPKRSLTPSGADGTIPVPHVSDGPHWACSVPLPEATLSLEIARVARAGSAASGAQRYAIGHPHQISPIIPCRVPTCAPSGESWRPPHGLCSSILRQSRCRADMQEMKPFLDDLREGNFRRALTENRVFKSIFRTGYPSTPRNQALIMFNNVFLHLHPVRIRRESLKITYTFCLGGLSFFLFLLLTVTGVLLMFYYRPATAVAYSDMKDLETV